MTSIAEALKERRIARMREGQSVPEIFPLRSAPDVRVALIPLTEAEYDLALAQAAAIEVADNSFGLERRGRHAQAVQLWYSVRDPLDLTKLAFDSVDEMRSVLEPADINFILEKYTEMVDLYSPGLEDLTDEQMDELKKALQAIDLRGLYGKPAYHLKCFFLTLTVDQLQDRSPWLTYTDSLTPTSDEPESIPVVEQN